MARLLGLVSPAPETPPGWPRRVGGWLVGGGVFAVGVAVPLIWVPYLAYSFRRATAQIAQRAGDLYFGEGASASDEAARLPAATAATPRATPHRISAAMLFLILRSAVAVLLTVVAVLLVLGFDIRIADQSWLGVLAGVLTLSVLTGLIMLWRVARPWQRRRS